MELKRPSPLFGAAAVLFTVGVGAAFVVVQSRADVPLFRVDPFWPRPLEYPQILGAVTGVAVGPQDNVYVVTRRDKFTTNTEIGATLSVPGGECCVPSSPVLQYDPQGALVRQWGGPSERYTWFNRPHGIAVDPQGNVWIGGSGTPAAPAAAAAGGAAAGRGAGAGGGRGGGAAGAAGGPAAAPAPGTPTTPNDTHILKFSANGQFVAQIGTPNAQVPNSRSTTSFGGVARIAFDRQANEVYVADGYVNRRVVVLDMTTGAVKRFWGAYGEQPDDADIGPFDPDAPPARQFRTVTCAVPSNDGLVYVCDRGNNRIQIFRKNGQFVSEKVIALRTRGAVTAGLSKDRGSVWDIALSPDAAQRFLYVADGMNERIWVLDRQSMEIQTTFGTGGRYPSHFQAVGSIAVDSRGNVFTGEDEEGKRVQRFVNTGMGPVPAMHQGAVWPTGNP